jgi:uncharacterized protein YdeI (YjbR/CyaY-like superfamily)
VTDHEEKAGLPIIGFVTAEAWEAWLASQPRAAKGLWLKIAKSGSGIASVSRREAIDVALCHGWIDGQLDRYDEHAWLIRFTPRKRKSRWSQLNRERAETLIAAGRMRPAGLAEVLEAQADGRWSAAYAPQSKAEVPADLQAALDAEPAAKRFFATLGGAQRYAFLYRVHAAKTPQTRAQRIETYVAMLAREETLHPRDGGRKPGPAASVAGDDRASPSSDRSGRPPAAPSRRPRSR